MKKYKEYFITIGLEIHVALNTKEKLFSSTPNGFSGEDFQLLDAGVPGVLPVLSSEPVEMAVAFGLAVNSDIKKVSFFERKHYFYPDLPLGYQITQQHEPILVGGTVQIKDEDGKDVTVFIEHAHLECDAAKSIHDLYSQYSAIDLSRCASPLLEIVSTPCLHSPEEAKEYAKRVHALSMFMGICDGKIEEGSFRVDASISLCKQEGKLGTRVEIKNISSFSFLEAALQSEIRRQADVLDAGKLLDMETRLFDEKSMETKPMRMKETVDEYRYMPCPDIPALIIDDEFITDIKQRYDISYFEYQQKFKELFSRFSIKFDESLFSVYWTDKTKKVWKHVLNTPSMQTERTVRILAFWLPEVLTKEIQLEEFITLDKSALQAKELKDVVSLWLSSGKSIAECLPQMMSSDDLKDIVQNILVQFPEQITKYKNGEVKMLQFLIGKVMAQVKGKSPAQEVKTCVESCLS
jgi:aspartyl-tRNA(Asn)/glutamyl-tRNA(Gln) amidotransferase subunit B